MAPSCGDKPVHSDYTVANDGKAVLQDRRPQLDGDYYEIRVEGHLGTSGERWSDGLTVHHEDGGTTLLGGTVDQAGLHGILMRIRDLGLTLVSVNRLAVGSRDVGASGEQLC